MRPNLVKENLAVHERVGEESRLIWQRTVRSEPTGLKVDWIEDLAMT